MTHGQEKFKRDLRTLDLVFTRVGECLAFPAPVPGLRKNPSIKQDNLSVNPPFFFRTVSVSDLTRIPFRSVSQLNPF